MITIPMTREEFSARAEALKEKRGIDISGDAGVLSYMGAKGTYAYDGQQLTVTVTKAPFLFSKSYCEGLIHNEFSQ